MEIYFNELSITDKSSISYEAVQIMAGIYRELKRNGITTCRIGEEDSNSLFYLIKKLPNANTIQNFFFSFFKSPYESDEVENKQEEYCEHSWFYKEKECFGLAIAFVLDSLCYSIFDQTWNDAYITIRKDSQQVEVRHVCTEQHVGFHMESLLAESEIELATCSTSAEDKKIVLRDDHGKDKLLEFSNKLVHSPYVVGVINSLPFQSHNRKFISKIRENGLIDIVLPWTDKGLGLVVQTTGRTRGETEKIADLLQEKYGYR